MLVLHCGFDTVTLSIKASLPEDVHAAFAEAKAQAEETRTVALVEVNGVSLHLEHHGGKGYAYLASGGPHGANWSFKKPNAKDPWGIRVTLGSELLAAFGLGGARAHMEGILDRLGVTYTEEDVSLARVDVCADILAPHVALDPQNFVMPATTKRRDYLEADKMQVHGTSGQVQSVTAGSPANRQVIIYDKRAEVIAKHKRHWWLIWQRALDGHIARGINLPFHKLDPSNPETSRVLRVELRAGKRLLKDRWGIRTWADLFDKFGDVSRETGEMYRYCDPTPGDTNRARWPNHPLWEIACAEINTDLTEMRSGVEPSALKEVHRETHIGVLARNCLGNAVSHAALHDVKFRDLGGHFGELRDEMSRMVDGNPGHYRKLLRRAKDRYVYIRKPDAPM